MLVHDRVSRVVKGGDVPEKVREALCCKKARRLESCFCTWNKRVRFSGEIVRFSIGIVCAAAIRTTK